MRIFAFLLFFFAFGAHAQLTVSGIVSDSKNDRPLPFATIKTADGRTVVGDVDGKFVVEKAQEAFPLIISYTGYRQEKVHQNRKRDFYKIKLEPKTEKLNEVVITAVNPANDVIKEAIKRRNMNDPQQRLNSFRYKAYDRLVVTANPDSISGALDSVYVYSRAGRRLEKIDSSFFKFKKLISRQHLYQTEKVSEYNFNKGQGLKETILATRMAGFKKPLYEIVGLTLQSWSVYSKNIELIETRYAGPLAEAALNDYRYKILDTVKVDGRSAYMVYFSPKNEHRKKRMEGILYIDRENYGVARSVFRVRNILDITSEHFFKYEPEYKLWFPDRRRLKIVKGNNKRDVKILGETIKFDADDTKNDRDREASDYVYLLSEEENFEKEFNIPVAIKHPDVAIEIEGDAISRPETYWNNFRKDTLDPRSMHTYTALDSIVASENWEKRIFLGKKIINGYLPIGFFDLDLRDIIKYNNYEGFRLGAGGTTNDKFAETFRISGYGAYGTKDGMFKYSGGAAVRLDKFSNTWIGAAFTDDIKEIGSTDFVTDKRVFKIYDPRPINVSTFYNYQTWQMHIESRVIPKTEGKLILGRNRIDPKFNYFYIPDEHVRRVFSLATATLSLQWNPFSDYMQTPSGRIETEKRYPKFAFQFTQAVKGIFDSDYTFEKIDFRTEYEKKYLNGQKTALLFQAGIALGNTPLTHLYSTSPNNLDKDGVLPRITFAGRNSFETMYFNEFFSSQYVIAQVKHGLKKFTIYNKLKLSPVVVTRFAWGNMEHNEDHLGLEYNTLEKGYYESGLELNEIYRGLGFSAFYRYGPYHLPQFDRNISIKISFIIDLGL